MSTLLVWALFLLEHTRHQKTKANDSCCRLKDCFYEMSRFSPHTHALHVILPETYHLTTTTQKLPNDSLLAEVARHIRLPEAVQVEEALGETFGSCHISAAAAVGEGVAAAQTEPVTEVLVQLRVCRQASFISAEEHKETTSCN